MTHDVRRTTNDGRRTTPRVWHKLPTGELKILEESATHLIAKRKHPMGHMHERRLSLNPGRFSPPDYIFRMHEGRLSLIRELVPVLNQQKLILLGGRFKGGLNSD